MHTYIHINTAILGRRLSLSVYILAYGLGKQYVRPHIHKYAVEPSMYTRTNMSSHTAMANQYVYGLEASIMDVVYKRIYVSMRTCKYVHMRWKITMHMCRCIRLCRCTNMHMYVCAYTYICACLHVYTHTHSHREHFL
jgi:hypothetical protein